MKQCVVLRIGTLTGGPLCRDPVQVKEHLKVITLDTLPYQDKGYRSNFVFQHCVFQDGGRMGGKIVNVDKGLKQDTKTMKQFESK